MRPELIKKEMTIKRRNHGRNRKGRGHCGKTVVCSNCAKREGADKAVRRFTARNMVDSSSMRDVREASAYEGTGYQMPKLYAKIYLCISCAVHQRVVRGRSAEERKNRDPPPRFRR